MTACVSSPMSRARRSTSVTARFKPHKWTWPLIWQKNRPKNSGGPKQWPEWKRAFRRLWIETISVMRSMRWRLFQPITGLNRRNNWNWCKLKTQIERNWGAKDGRIRCWDRWILARWNSRGRAILWIISRWRKRSLSRLNNYLEASPLSTRATWLCTDHRKSSRNWVKLFRETLRSKKTFGSTCSKVQINDLPRWAPWPSMPKNSIMIQMECHRCLLPCFVRNLEFLFARKSQPWNLLKSLSLESPSESARSGRRR